MRDLVVPRSQFPAPGRDEAQASVFNLEAAALQPDETVASLWGFWLFPDPGDRAAFELTFLRWSQKHHAVCIGRVLAHAPAQLLREGRAVRERQLALQGHVWPARSGAFAHRKGLFDACHAYSFDSSRAVQALGEPPGIDLVAAYPFAHALRRAVRKPVQRF